MSKSFIRNFFIFCLPFASIFLAMLLSAAYFRESIPPYFVLEAATENPIVYRPIWQPLDFARYKLEASILYHPRVLILGSSRSVQVHSGIFNRQRDAVYNAGFDAAVIHDIWQMVQILERENALPELLILQMNYPDFNADMPNTTNLNIQRANFFSNLEQIWSGTLWAGRRWRIVSSLVLEEQSAEVSHFEYWGLIAASEQIGYLADGSEYNAQLNPELAQRLYETQYQEFEARTGNFTAGDSLHEENLWKLSEIVRIASENDVQLVAYFPPYRSTIYHAMLESGDYAYIPLAQEAIAALFAENHYPFFDFSDISLVDGQDEEVYDAWHSGQRLNMRLFLAMTEAEATIFEPYIELSVLRDELENSHDPFFVYINQP